LIIRSINTYNATAKNQNKVPGQEVRAGSSRKTPEINGNMEAVFQPESLPIFFISFWLASRSFGQKMLVKHRKKSENFPVGILLRCAIIFQRFPAGFSEFSTSLHPVPVKFRSFPEAGIVDLGSAYLIESNGTRCFNKDLNLLLYKCSHEKSNEIEAIEMNATNKMNIYIR
jgi:hypothetical protein